MSAKRLYCSECEKLRVPAQVYGDRNKPLCEQCCLVIYSRPARKTHWQYIRSVKADYLQPAKQK